MASGVRRARLVDQVAVEVLQDGAGGGDVARVERAHHLGHQVRQRRPGQHLRPPRCRACSRRAHPAPGQAAALPANGATCRRQTACVPCACLHRDSEHMHGLAREASPLLTATAPRPASQHRPRTSRSASFQCSSGAHRRRRPQATCARTPPSQAEGAHLAADDLGLDQRGQRGLQVAALAHVAGVQLRVGQLAQARALQVRLAQAERAAVGRDHAQRAPDAVHLRARTAWGGVG